MNSALARYEQILSGDRRPKFKAAALTVLSCKAAEILQNCELCEHRCHKNRVAGELGTCQVGTEILISSYFDHYGEEPFFVPSFTIFFWSCTFACQFCQNWSISHRHEPPTQVTVEDLARIIDSHSYCKNANFVGGEPTSYLPFILQVLQKVRADIPVVWNSNFYMSERSMEFLSQIVDVYLSDFKYGNDECALRLSKVSDYTRIVKRNHLIGLAGGELVIRHLVLPNHVDCCSVPVLNWVAEFLGDQAIINLMAQYRPEYKAWKYPELDRRITLKEFNKVVERAERLGLNFIT